MQATHLEPCRSIWEQSVLRSFAPTESVWEKEIKNFNSYSLPFNTPSKLRLFREWIRTVPPTVCLLRGSAVLKIFIFGTGGDIFIVLNCCHVLQRGVFNLILLLSIFCLNRSLARATGCHTTLLNLVKHATSVRRRHCCRVESARLEHLYMCQEGWKVYADIYTSEVYVIQEWKIIIMPTATGLACSMYSMPCFLKKCHTFFLQSCYTSSYSAYFLYNAYSDDYDNDNNILTDA